MTLVAIIVNFRCFHVKYSRVFLLRLGEEIAPLFRDLRVAPHCKLHCRKNTNALGLHVVCVQRLRGTTSALSEASTSINCRPT